MPRILGWDAAEVIAVGSDYTLFQKGDAVYYTGSISRPGTNYEFHLLDKCILGKKPKDRLRNAYLR
jgi:NADPH2:quinone reductase